MHLVINGESRDSTAGSLADLLAELKLQAEQVVVEVNRTIVERSRFAETRLQEDDRLEIIQFVGGG